MNTETWKKPIIFDLDKVENIAEEEATVTLDYTPPVILPENTELETDNPFVKPKPTTTSEIHSLPPPEYKKPTTVPLLWLAGSLGLLLLLMLLVDTYHFIVQQYASSLFLGTLFLSLILIITGTALTLSWRAYKNIQQLSTVSKLQTEGHQLIESEDYGRAIPYLNKIAQFYVDKPNFKNRLERFYLTLNDSHHDREVCSLFSHQLMKDIDQQAYNIVTQRSKEIALMTAISQIAFLDTILTLWRDVRMIRDIAILYGGKPGFLATMSLIIGVLQDLIYADVSEMAADSVAEILGGSMLSFMSAQAAQGVGSGIITARLGLQAMQKCRPLPFLEEEKPSLKDIRWEIVSTLKGLFENKEVKNNTRYTANA
jgi:putative membrane protein